MRGGSLASRDASGQFVPLLFGFQGRICLVASLGLAFGNTLEMGEKSSCVSQGENARSLIVLAKLFSTN